MYPETKITVGYVLILISVVLSTGWATFVDGASLPEVIRISFTVAWAGVAAGGFFAAENWTEVFWVFVAYVVMSFVGPMAVVAAGDWDRVWPVALAWIVASIGGSLAGCGIAQDE
jgi:hypothetical protein